MGGGACIASTSCLVRVRSGPGPWSRWPRQSPVNACQMGCEPPGTLPARSSIAALGCVKCQVDQGGGLLQSCLGSCSWSSISCLARPRSLRRSNPSEPIRSSTPPTARDHPIGSHHLSMVASGHKNHQDDRVGASRCRSPHRPCGSHRSRRLGGSRPRRPGARLRPVEGRTGRPCRSGGPGRRRSRLPGRVMPGLRQRPHSRDRCQTGRPGRSDGRP